MRSRYFRFLVPLLLAVSFLPIAIGGGAETAAISVIGTSFVSTKLYKSAKIDVPDKTKRGDLLVMFIGGSGKYKDEEPRGPTPSVGWKEIASFGDKDISQAAFYKFYDDPDESSYKIEQRRKSLFVSMVTLRGVHTKRPIVDSEADGTDTLSGLNGESRAPAVNTRDGGIVLVSYAYDDPHSRVEVVTSGFSTLLSNPAASLDGMTIGASGTTRDGIVGPIDATGKYAEGRGQEVAMAVSFRSAGATADRDRTHDGEEEAMTWCGDGTTVVPGMTFCYIKRNDDGSITRNEAKKCTFFLHGDTGTRLKNHCNWDNLGALSCSACASA